MTDQHRHTDLVSERCCLLTDSTIWLA